MCVIFVSLCLCRKLTVPLGSIWVVTLQAVPYVSEFTLHSSSQLEERKWFLFCNKLHLNSRKFTAVLKQLANFFADKIITLFRELINTTNSPLQKALITFHFRHFQMETKVRVRVRACFAPLETRLGKKVSSIWSRR